MQSNTGSSSNANLEKSIQKWIELDNELKLLNEQVKEMRTRKNDMEDKIIITGADDG